MSKDSKKIETERDTHRLSITDVNNALSSMWRGGNVIEISLLATLSYKSDHDSDKHDTIVARIG